MQSVLAVTAPIYLLIAIGYAAVRFGWMAQPDMRVLGCFVAQFCVPALLFRAMLQNLIGAVLQGDYIAIYAGGSVLALAAVAALLAATVASFFTLSVAIALLPSEWLSPI